MRILIIVATFAVGMAFSGATVVLADCGACKGDEKHSHKDHVHALKEYKEGMCCSADHFAKKQKEAIKAKALTEYKEGACCSADHFATKKVAAVEMATYKKEYKKGACCSAEHYAKNKMKAAKKDAK